MKLWVDEYRPKDLSALDYHKEQAADLKNLTKDGDFPHLLVYGPMGAGKNTRIQCLLRELFGAGADRVKRETMNFTTPSNKKLEITSFSSNYHIVVQPSDVGIYDRVVIMDLIKQMAQNQQVTANAERSFKVVVIKDVDNLTKDAQHALRRTMEKYIANCRLILCANSVSRVIPAIKSRCLCIRVPAPTHATIVQILKNICDKEKIKIPDPLAEEIAKKCDRNLRRAILMLQACRMEKFPFVADQKVSEPDWMLFIKKTAALILNTQNIANLTKVREHLYELINNAIPSELIFKTLLRELLKKCDINMIAEITHEAAVYEHRMVQGNKQIFHLEAFVAKFMYIYRNHMQSLVEGF